MHQVACNIVDEAVPFGVIEVEQRGALRATGDDEQSRTATRPRTVRPPRSGRSPRRSAPGSSSRESSSTAERPRDFLLARDDRGHVLGRPDLPVRVRIAGPHLRSSIFEDLDMSDVRVCAELLVLFCPGLDDPLDRCRGKVSETEVVAW